MSKKKATWAQAKKGFKRPRASVSIATRSDVIAEAEALDVELRQAREEDERHNRQDRAPEIARRIQALEAEAAESEIEFVFEGLGRGEYARLIAAHQPTEQQKRDAKSAGVEAPYNTDSFPPALMAASCIEPAELAGNVAEWTEIHDTWSLGQVTKLWRTVNTANAGVAELPKSVTASVVLALLSSDNS